MKGFNFVSPHLLEQLSTAGVLLSPEDDCLVVKGYLTDHLRRKIRKYKQDLIELLQSREDKWKPQGEWQFSFIRIPNQMKHGLTDIWVLGKRIDKPEITFWFVASHKQDRD